MEYFATAVASGGGGGGSSTPAPATVVRVNSGGTGGATASPYTIRPFDTVIVDLSTGNVVLNGSALTLGQWWEVGQDEGTAWTSNTLTLNAPAAIALALPPPSNGAFTAVAGAIVFPISPATAAQSKGFLQRWVNAGSAAEYLCK
jgi:hypothetical protein